MKAEWIKVASVSARSSHVACNYKSKLIIFSGEATPRVPVKNDLLIYDHDKASIAHGENRGAPEARVGAAATRLGGSIYLFGGRGGVQDLSVLQDGLYRYEIEANLWTSLPANGAIPEPRSYHAMTALGDRIYIHAGCGVKGRLSQLHAYDTKTETFIRLHDAPGSARGGTAIAPITATKLVRFGGFDGGEMGQCVDVYDTAKDEWITIPFDDSNGRGPGPRSVALLTKGTDSCILVHGEKSPASNGHEGAGSFWDDVWSLRLSPDEESITWTKIVIEGDGPKARGWYAGDSADDGSVIIHGGIDDKNQRLDDLWMLHLV